MGGSDRIQGLVLGPPDGPRSGVWLSSGRVRLRFWVGGVGLRVWGLGCRSYRCAVALSVMGSVDGFMENNRLEFHMVIQHDVSYAFALYLAQNVSVGEGIVRLCGK